ncbi:hypothetical protein [Pseudoxanthomonas daejeonensis]|uniref:hypothetical protein n=1 Tax=Pseudoxanthomonas daejeonensis TaxID=266062 RepID=UPI001391D2FA|nr:hypothetical protein [Pseudoxanthomonas daejeonensis]
MHISRPFASFVDACRARGISRSVAFQLAKNGLLETFTIGRRRYVFIDSLDSLGERLSERKNPREALA